MVCFGGLGRRAGDELFVVGLELDFGGVVERGQIARKRWEKGLYFEYGSGKIEVTKLQDI